MDIKGALSVLVEAGCDVTFNHVHVYKHNTRKAIEYVILHFDKKSNIKPDSEESFAVLEDAIGKFVRYAGGKLGEYTIADTDADSKARSSPDSSDDNDSMSAVPA